ncbi:MAG TPA: DUF2017 family protein [Actinomycetota bacterium]|jgi:hypothetical protein|nr:DUF2017 family protein [Actinomycetota bacterium]
MPPARVKRTRKGEYLLRLTANERDVIRTLPETLREALAGDPQDPALRRLFPAAYPDDPARSQEFDELVRDDLLSERLSAVETMERTLDAQRVGEDELLAWLSAINDLRLVLGTRIGVTEEMTFSDLAPDDPRVPSFALYSFLGVLEEDVVGALSR